MMSPNLASYSVAGSDAVAMLYRPTHPRLLLVHDEVAAIQSLYHALGHDHQLFMASAGEQVLPMCLQHIPDLVLLKVALPDDSGIDICRQLSTDERTAHIPVVLLTDGEDVLQQVSGIQAGAAECLAQPVNPVLAKLRVSVQLALHYQARLLNEQLEHDAVSGVGNRKRFDRQLATEWRRAVRNGEPLTLLLLDIGCTRTPSGQPGDAQLRQVADSLSGRLQRPADTISHWGQGRFACILPNTPWVHGMALGHELRASLGQVWQLVAVAGEPTAGQEEADIRVGVAVRTGDSLGSMAGLLALAESRLADACQPTREPVQGVVLP